MVHVGFDHHKSFSYVTIMDEKGQTKRQQKLLNDRETLYRYINKLQQEEKQISLALEVGRDWYWVYLESKGVSLYLAHPKKTKAIASARIKTDKIDSKNACSSSSH